MGHCPHGELTIVHCRRGCHSCTATSRDGAPPRPLLRLYFRTRSGFTAAPSRPADSRTPMRLSRFFLPILRETPKEAEIVSHRLMLRAGMMRQEASGIYAFLPLGLRVLKKIEQIVREEQNRAGAIELLMPTIQSADLWKESGRYEAYGKEMLRIEDRHEREMLYGPDQRGDDHRHLPGLRALLQGPAAQSLPHPMEVPGRGPAAFRPDARPRIPDEGRLFVRRRSGRRAAFLQQDVRRLSAHVRPARPEVDSDACGKRADRRRHEPRIHHPGLDRRVGGLLPQGLSGFCRCRRRRGFRRHGRLAGDRGPMDVELRGHIGHARRRGVRRKFRPTSRCRRAASRSATSSISAPNIPSR